MQRFCVVLSVACCLALCVANGLPADEVDPAKDERIVQTVMRLPNFDLHSKPETKAAVVRYLGRIEGEEKFFQLVDKFNLAADVAPSLLKQALAEPESNLGVNCARLLLKADAVEGLREAIAGEDPPAIAALTALGLSGEPKLVPLALPVVTDTERSTPVRVAAATALGRVAQGQKELLELVVQERLASDLTFAAANALLTSDDEAIRTEAAKHLSLPATADAKPLPPIATLLQSMGDAAAGKLIFENKGTCAKCHVVDGEGKEVGPNLSEIGSKLSKEAIYLSILDPSAGISFNYETSQVVTDEGQIITGIVVSDTDEAITLKTAEAIIRTFPKSEVEEVNRLKTSLMPADLQRQLTAKDLIDVVEYLTTLKKK
jgi:putative heme-binding domain-containing protein